ncbi:MAG: S8 family serine peptidase [Planctomycetota bacterium]
MLFSAPNARIRLAAIVTCLAAFPLSSLSAQDESFVNGDSVISLTVDASEIGVLFGEDTTREEVSGLLSGLPFVAKEAAANSVYIPGHLMKVETVPGATAQEVLDGTRALGGQPQVLAAGPRFLDGVEPYFVTDEILVRYQSDVEASDVAKIEAEHGLERSGSLDYSVNPGVVYRLPHGRSLDAMAITRAIHDTGHAEFAIPDFSLVRIPCATTNDPLFGNQWHLHSTGQNGAKVDADVDAPEAWDYGRGDPGLKIAVIDTGVELSHPDLVRDLVQGIDVLDDDNTPQAEDYFFGLFTENHATSVCGVTAGPGNNALGTSGLAQDCKLMPIRFLSEYILVQPTVQDEADAFNFARNNGAAVVNCSWGPSGAAALPTSTRAAIDDAVDNGRGGLGLVIFFAAGNSSADTSGNGYVTYPKTLAVSASTDQDLLASYSSFGAAVEFCAPSNGGVNGITTTDRLGTVGYSSGDYTDAFGGTSSASPLAAGVALLVLSANPNLTWLEVRDIMRDTAVKIDPAGGAYDANGHSNKYGYGRVNAHDAVVAAQGTPGVTYSGAGHPGTGGVIPEIGTSGGTPSVGNAGFAITLSNTLPSTTIGLLFGLNPASIPFKGGTMLVDLTPPGFLFIATSDGSGGYVLPTPVPASAPLVGFKVYGQWLAADAAASRGYSMTEGVELEIQP